MMDIHEVYSGSTMVDTDYLLENVKEKFYVL